jgi:site-specific DNA-methyltransferase (adenine-specific)
LIDVYQSSVNVIHRADAHEVAATFDPGSFSLAVLDGPYGMNKAEVWDGMKVSELPAWYAPHLDDVGRLCALSASLYVWNTSEGWATLHAGIEARGWVFRSLVTWHKPDGQAHKSAHEAGARCWPDVTEVCGFYQREAWAPSTCAGQEIAYAAGADERNWIRLWLCGEWAAAGLRNRQADEALGTNRMAGHYFGTSQWSLPTWEAYQTLAAYADAHGPPRDRPYLVHASVWPSGDLRASYDHLRAEYDHLRAEYDHLRAEYDHLRAEYEASRPAFTCPHGVSNVWTHTQVTGDERLRGIDGDTLHQCQKPIAFAERIIRASTRPGEHVWVPFGGTCREAVAAEWMARREPDEARQVVTCEIDQDGRDYLGAVVRQMEGKDLRTFDLRQGVLL